MVTRKDKGSSGADRHSTPYVTRLICCVLLLMNACVSAEPLRVYDWPFGRSVFGAHLPSFERITGYPVEYHTVGFPFSENVEQNFIHGEPMDIVGMFPTAVRRLADAGWIENLSDDQRFVEAVEHSYPNVESSLRIDGQLFGVGQSATGLAVPLVDMDKYAELGFGREDFPRDWSSLNYQLVSAAKAGHPDIYLPFWFDDINGLPLGFMAEVINRGGNVIHPDTGGVAMRPDAGPAVDTLVDWRHLMVSGAVAPSVLDMSLGQFIGAFYFGEHAISSHKTTMLLLAKNRRTHSPNISLLPRAKQSWGVASVLLLGLVKKERESKARDEARRKLLLLNTRGEGDLRFSVARMWLKQSGYFSTYKDYMASDEAQSILRSKLTYPEDAKVLSDVFDNLDYPEMAWQVVWHHEFFNYMKDQLQLYLKSTSMQPSEVIKKLNRKIVQLRALYGY